MLEGDVARAHETPGQQREHRGDRAEADGHQERHALAEPRAAEPPLRGGERDDGERHFLRPGEVGARGEALLAHREGLGQRQADRERVLRADRHAVEALHAAGVDDLPVLGDLFVHAHVAGADGGAVAARVARRADDDAHRGDAVGEREHGTVRAAVRAEALGPEPPDDQEPDHQERADRHDRAGERAPEIVGLQPPLPRRRVGQLPVAEPVLDVRPQEHVAGDDPRRQHQQARAQRPRPDAELAEPVRAQVLQRHDMAGPAAEEAAEDERQADQREEQHEAGVDRAFLDRLHGFRRLDGRQRAAREQPVHDVGADQDVHGDQHERAPARCAGRRDRAAARLVAVEARQERQRVAGLRLLVRAAGRHRSARA